MRTVASHPSPYHKVIVALLLGVALSLIVFSLMGCATAALSSAERRAGFYRPETRATYNPRTGEIDFASSGDDEFELDEARFGSNYVRGMRFKGKRSTVVQAQGERLTDNFVELMGQDIEYHRIVADWLIQSYGMTLQAATELAPVLGGMARDRIARQQPSAGQQLRPYLEAAARELLARNGIAPPTATTGGAPVTPAPSSPAGAAAPAVETFRRVAGEGAATTTFVPETQPTASAPADPP